MASTLGTIKTAINELVFNNKEHETVVPAQPQWSDTKKMKCLVWNGKLQVDYVDHPQPIITAPTDAIVKVSATTICGSDLHLYKGTFAGMQRGDILGHEFMGYVQEVGSEVSKFKVGDRVVCAFGIACGFCNFCQKEEYTSCDKTNPSKTQDNMYGDRLSAIHGYSHLLGGVPGGDAEYVRVSIADVNLFLIPDDIPDEKALYLTDVIPTALHGAKLGEVGPGKTVAIWGLGPIGLMCARWCQILGASKVIGIDMVPERLAVARDVLKIETINFKDEDVFKAIRERLELPSGVDVAIECAGFDYAQSWAHKIEMKLGLETDSSEIFQEIFRCVSKGGNVSIIGVYTGYANHFPVGAMMEKNITVRGGQCPAQKYWKYCLEKLRTGEIDTDWLVTHRGSLADGPKLFEKMNNKEDGCIKVFMRPEHTIAASLA